MIIFCYFSSTSSGFGAHSFQSPVLGESGSMYYRSQSKDLSESREMDDPRFYQELLVWVHAFFYLIMELY